MESFTFWLNNVVGNGVLVFLQICTHQSRQAAKHLFDAKASELAAQVVELAAEALQIAEAERLRYASQKLSSFYLFTKAYPQQHASPALLRQEIRRLIVLI